MRIAAFYNNPYGGAGRVVYEYCHRLGDRDSVTVFTLSPPGEGFDRLEDLAPIRPQVFRGWHSLPRGLGRLGPVMAIAGLRKLDDLYREVADLINDRFDVALVFPCHVTPAPLLLRHLRIPSVLLMYEAIRSFVEPTIPRPYLADPHLGRLSHASAWIDPMGRVQRRQLRRADFRNAQRAHRTLTISYYSREMLYRAYGINAHVNYLGVDTAKFSPDPGRERIDEVVSVGRVTPEKGHDFVIRALSMITPSMRPALTIAGDGGRNDEASYLAQLAERLGVRLQFETSRCDDEIVDRYRRAKITAFAPVLEPFGLVPLESLACGTPVVAVREAGIRESVADRRGGFLVDRDPGQMATAVEALLSDPDLHRLQSRCGVDYVARCWRWDDSTSRLRKHIESVIK